MYKLFKKSDIKIKFINQLSKNNLPFKILRIIGNDNKIYCGYNDNGQMFVDFDQCPRLTVGDSLICKNIEKNEYENLGVLKEIKNDEIFGYIFII